jgi:hypothetical protein
MSLKKFEDFENHLAEEDKNALANDYVNASRDLVNAADKITGIIRGANPDEVIIQMTEEFQIKVKVIGYVQE